MAALDFPDSPTTGQVYDKWTWNGTMWVLTAAGGSGGGGSGFTFNQDTTPTATKVGDTWFETDTGDSFVWTNDGNSTQWVQFAPGSGGGGGSGFTYVTDTAPTPSKAGDTWFDISTAASGGTSWVAVSAVPGAAGPLKWVQFAPGSGQDQKGYWAAAVGIAGQAIVASGITTVSWQTPVLGNIVYEPPAIGTLAFVIPRAGTYLMTFRYSGNIGGTDRARINWMGQFATDTAAVGGSGSNTQMFRVGAGEKFQFQTYNGGAAGAFTLAMVEIRELGSSVEGLNI